MYSIKEVSKLLKKREHIKSKIVLCHGVFDLLHIGHIKYLEEAKTFGDILVVSLTPDNFVNKGPGRPVFHQELRADAINSLKQEFRRRIVDLAEVIGKL